MRLLTKVYVLETLSSIGGNLLLFGIFFYMQKRFGWGANRNLTLSSAQGMAYVLGALAANPLSKWIDRLRLLRVVEFGLCAVALAGACVRSCEVIVVVLLGYTMLSAVQWPLMESLISIGAGPRELSRRISVYNLVWSGSGALTIAGCGLVIEHFPPGIFVIAGGVHLIASGLLMRTGPVVHEPGEVQLRPEPELIPLRSLAKRLSRIALPATFAVIYALGAIMPTLAVIRVASPAMRTVLASVWMMARWLFFIFLGATSWWHTRPRALLVAAMVLLGAFLGITLLSSIASMIFWQIALGVAMGLIYSASLYFGMVLSDGSTAQNAYHEALIGFGSILGPGCGAMAGVFRPGDPHVSVIAIAAVLWISVLAACVVSVQSRRSTARGQG